MTNISTYLSVVYRRTLKTVAGRRPSPCLFLCSPPVSSSHWSSTTGRKPGPTHQSGRPEGSWTAGSQRMFFCFLNLPRGTMGHLRFSRASVQSAAEIKGYLTFLFFKKLIETHFSFNWLGKKSSKWARELQEEQESSLCEALRSESLRGTRRPPPPGGQK